MSSSKIFKMRNSSTLFLCVDCYIDHYYNNPELQKNWEESPLDECSICGTMDTDARKEYDVVHKFGLACNP